MPIYEVEFQFTTGMAVIVEAKDEAEAQILARRELDEMSGNSLPEMWPDDFVITSVTQA